MIKNKVDYKYYLAEDLKRYHLRFIDRFIFNENYYTVKYLKALRRLEYLTNIKKNNCGRPAGRIKTAKIEISIEPTVKDEFMTLLRKEGKTASVEIGLWIRE